MPHPIQQAEFIRAIVHVDQAPETRPAVVFAGRSNVGKSSLINKLIGSRHLARTSNTPGRTREIHYYGIDETYYFIDLPGYGYAKVSREVQRQWGPMIEHFFHEAEGLRLVVIILDVRRDPTFEDQRMIEWLESRAIPYIFAITKIDKVTRNELKKRLRALQSLLGLDDDNALIPLSAQTGQGVEDLLGVIRAAWEAPAPPAAPEAPAAEHEQEI